MIFQAIFKAILLYFAFIFIRGIYRGYKQINVIKEGFKEGGFQSSGNPYNSSNEGYTQKTQPQSSDIVDVEYKVVKD
ncbi:MAG: hypothetical protein GY909_09580 [Oligoflexia bacterium]|nr:hypothetical protein [Oligoflexia bacterium]